MNEVTFSSNVRSSSNFSYKSSGIELIILGKIQKLQEMM